MVNYRPRNDYCIVRLETITENKFGMAIPISSNEAKKWIIHAVGPDVKDIKPGDVVQLMGKVGEDLAVLPREKDLYISRQANILYVVEETPDEEVYEEKVSDK